jgi:hypothetical protein
LANGKPGTALIGMRTTLDFQGATVAVTSGEGKGWDVEVAGTHHHARYLDVALEQAFPNARQSERNLLQINVHELLDRRALRTSV